MVSRRELLAATAGSVVLAILPQFATGDGLRRKPPFRVLYNNDATNTLSCTSPWHKKGESFRPEMLESSVDEVAGTGVELHLLAPGLCWVPWWASKIYPIQEHYQWLKETYGIKPDSFGRYLLDGGDMVKVFIDRCRKTGQTPFITFRMNDGHHKESPDAKPGDKIAGARGQGLTKEYVAHPEYRIGPDSKDWNQRVWNWAIPDVRARRFSFLRELCENYDLEGIELDFLRHPSFFQVDKTTSDERRSIMTGFVGQVRELLNRTAPPGRHRWLSVRIPSFLPAHDPMGIDAKSFADAGVEMFNLSDNYFTEQQTDAARIKQMLPDSSVYLEMTHTTRCGPKISNVSKYDDFTFRRTTDEQFYTTAHLAYANGLNGVSAFNFAYYREHGTPLRGPFNEPPFHIFKHLGDAEWLAQQPQHFFVAQVWAIPEVPNRRLGDTKKPISLNKGQSAQIPFDLAPPTNGWTKDGKLRIETRKPLKDSRFVVTFNGVALKPLDDVSEPFPNPYLPLLGTPGTLRAWVVPAGEVHRGKKQIEVRLESGNPVTLVFLDLAFLIIST